MFEYSFFACIIGFILDLIIGDPYWIYHPVRLIGKLIEFSEKFLRKFFSYSDKGLKIGGLFLVIIVCVVVVWIVFLINFFAYKVNSYFGLAIESIFCYFLMATKSLKVESMKVYDKLFNDDILGARKAVSMIVGRDTQNLNEAGIIKATVETVAENLSDGVIAPLIFMLIGGSVFGFFYKAINTMDSMVGYKNDKYIFFGRCAAKFDDIVNFIPSRISAFAMIFASFICGKDYQNAFRIFKRDRFNHSSPNSAQTEAVCAGALNIRLAGDAYYFGKLYKKPFIGDDIKPVCIYNIIEVNRLMYVSAVLTLFIGCFIVSAIYCCFGSGFF